MKAALLAALFAVAAPLGLPLAAAAAPLGLPLAAAPRITATDVFVENDPDFGEFFAESFSLAFQGAPLGDLTLTRFDDGSGFVSIFGAGDPMDAEEVLTGDLLASGFGEGGIEFLFETDFDALGLGDRFLVVLAAGATPFPADPFATAFSIDDASLVAAAPIPLPAAAPLLLAALGGLVALRRRAAR
jgi:hypothetical protein